MSQNLNIEQTKSTPKLVFDAGQRVLSIEGQSYPENAVKFYEPLFSRLEEDLKENNNPLTVEINLYYMNTSSSKCIMTLIDKLEEAHSKGKEVKINWYYDEENEMALESAEDFKEDINLPFNIIPLKG